jgi:NADH pyrophosphatase NudC (nudix superfamily)
VAGAETNGDGVRATSFLQRAPLRRRLAHLRRRRELALRDLGGLVYESHRRGEEHPELVSAKLTALDAIDEERDALEQALDDHRELLVLREPGITVCAHCGAIHDSDAKFCPNCGTPAPQRGRAAPRAGTSEG